jgi:hypothetical protein
VNSGPRHHPLTLHHSLGHTDLPEAVEINGHLRRKPAAASGSISPRRWLSIRAVVIVDHGEGRAERWPVYRSAELSCT